MLALQAGIYGEMSPRNAPEHAIARAPMRLSGSWRLRGANSARWIWVQRRTDAQQLGADIVAMRAELRSCKCALNCRTRATIRGRAACVVRSGTCLGIPPSSLPELVVKFQRGAHRFAARWHRRRVRRGAAGPTGEQQRAVVTRNPPRRRRSESRLGALDDGADFDPRVDRCGAANIRSASWRVGALRAWSGRLLKMIGQRKRIRPTQAQAQAAEARLALRWGPLGRR
jgi:hypothetical protein